LLCKAQRSIAWGRIENESPEGGSELKGGREQSVGAADSLNTGNRKKRGVAKSARSPSEVLEPGWEN